MESVYHALSSVVEEDSTSRVCVPVILDGKEENVKLGRKTVKSQTVQVMDPVSTETVNVIQDSRDPFVKPSTAPLSALAKELTLEDSVSVNLDSREESVISEMISVIPKIATVMESVLMETVSANQDGRVQVALCLLMNAKSVTAMEEECVSQDPVNAKQDSKANTVNRKTVSIHPVQVTESALRRNVSANQDGKETTVLPLTTDYPSSSPIALSMESTTSRPKDVPASLVTLETTVPSVSLIFYHREMLFSILLSRDILVCLGSVLFLLLFDLIVFSLRKKIERCLNDTCITSQRCSITNISFSISFYGSLLALFLYLSISRVFDS